MDGDQEAVVALHLDLVFLKALYLGVLVGPGLVHQGCLSLDLVLGLAWVLLPDAGVLGGVFLRCLGVLTFRFLLSLEDVGDSGLCSCLGYFIRIVRSLHFGVGLEVALVLMVELSSLLER